MLQKGYLATYTCQYTDTEYKFCLMFLAGHKFGEEWSWLAVDEEVGQCILVHIYVYENAYLFRPVILKLFHTFFLFSIYGFIMTELLLIQMSSSSNAATVSNMFLLRLFVRI